MMRWRLGGAIGIACLLAALTPGPSLVAEGSCAELTTLSLPHTTIASADDDARGFCRVAATATPSNDSDIKIEVWLPARGWNGKLLAVGNGAFNGSIAVRAMEAAIARGYATASTDTGHEGGSASFGLGHPERVVDFGWRAVHEMTVAAKQIVAARYSTPPKYSYWSGCSAGGRQAMKEAQRFPADFDGILAGAPGLNWTDRAAEAVRVAKTLEKNDAARLTKTERERLHRAVLDRCDALDGVKDGLIENPKRCSIDPAAVIGLSPAQAATARLMYASGLQPGSELGWTDLGWTASARATGLDQFRFLVFGDPKWDPQSFDFDTDLPRARSVDADTIDARDPDLRPFIDRGGKLIQYHGWSDPQIAPVNSTDYYAAVAERLGAAQIRNAYRLFMAPGMGHCGGGEGPNTFDMIGALEQWVEQGTAPDRIVASHATNGRVDRTRPLCPYPASASYTGSGSIDDAANFVCRESSQPPPSRAEAFADMQAFDTTLLASRSATETLETWCRDHHLAADPRIVAHLVTGADKPLTAEQRQRLALGGHDAAKFRRVELQCGARVLSVADNWYVPARLTPEMNRQLETTDIPFGKAVAALEPTRQTVSVTRLWTDSRAAPPDALLELRALLYTRDRVPFSEVDEVYQRALLFDTLSRP